MSDFRRYATEYQRIERVRFVVPYGELDDFYEWAEVEGYTGGGGYTHLDNDGNMHFTMERVHRDTRHDGAQLELF